MVAKKNTVHTAPPRTHKVHRRKSAAIENLPTEASASADRILPEAAQMPATPPVASEAAKTASDPTAESSLIVMPTLAEETTATTDISSAPAAPAHKLSALDAAAKVLGESGQAMNCQELIAAMATKGYWQSPNGKTPAATLYSAMLREIQTKGDQARFGKTARGKFALRKTE
jgi:hypothetical protein